MVRIKHSGKYRRTRLFVLTLGYTPEVCSFVCSCLESSARVGTSCFAVVRTFHLSGTPVHALKSRSGRFY